MIPAHGVRGIDRCIRIAAIIIEVVVDHVGCVVCPSVITVITVVIILIVVIVVILANNSFVATYGIIDVLPYIGQ